jgi:hypothetical protein
MPAQRTTKTPDLKDARPLSERPLGYFLAFLGGGLAMPFGFIYSPLVLFALSKIMISVDGKQPNRFARWALIGCIAVPVNIAIFAGIGNRMIDDQVKACNSGDKNVCRELVNTESAHDKITNPAFSSMIKEKQEQQIKEKAAQLKAVESEQAAREARERKEEESKNKEKAAQLALLESKRAAREAKKKEEEDLRNRARLAKQTKDSRINGSPKQADAKSIPYMMATINNDGPVRENDITVARFRFILDKFASATGETEEQVGDRIVAMWKIVEKDYGRKVALLDYAERVRRMYDSLSLSTNSGGSKLLEFCLAAVTVSIGNE